MMETAVKLTTSKGLPDVFRDFVEQVLDWPDYGEARIEEIETEERSGFSPYTDGGFEGILPIPFRYGKDDWKCLEPYEQRDYEFMIEEFFSANAPEGETRTPEEFWRTFEARDTSTGDLLGARWQDEGRHKQERWRDEWEEADESYFFVKCRAIRYTASNRRNESGQDEVLLWCGVCLDFDYGRDSGDTCEMSENIPLADLTPEKLEQFTKQFRNHLAGC